MLFMLAYSVYAHYDGLCKLPEANQATYRSLKAPVATTSKGTDDR
jgi:hypothetical protein